ncbi:rod shape-determining protein RodA [Clostridium sp. DJ247]|uniref:rod shape-determining protein RodA n=1 Tax=Clostridium sp. DJ247 TaxID=2726188 RepID=UPI00162A6881|nr:rod shape-determining protein RodA [Clostridium sp. DJ247]MBC2580628.1 rod shape-determining protein RodA [Clostridium sp. DJ247]
MLNKLILGKKLFRELDITAIVIVVIIVVFGSLNIYSAKHLQVVNGQSVGAYYLRAQLIWLVIGLILSYFILVFDYSVIQGYTNIIYWFGIFLLVLNRISIFKSTVNGAASWIKIGGFSMQPSEFAKIGMIIMLAKQLNDMEGKINDWKNFLKLTAYAALPMLLIVVQPDMGMTMVCFFIVLGIYFSAGLDLKVIGGGILGVIIAVAIVWNSSIIESYQKARLVSFLNPEADELGTGLQLIQSQIGIGSGGILGKGFLKGTQISGGFVPEAHTDFIFSVVGEEWGLIGAVILLILYGILIYKFINIAKNSKDIFGSVICIGMISTMLFSILQNIGMTIGIMPITGITLPFMSYGGSSMLTSFISLGLVLNIGMRRKKINF